MLGARGPAHPFVGKFVDYKGNNRSMTGVGQAPSLKSVSGPHKVLDPPVNLLGHYRLSQPLLQTLDI